MKFRKILASVFTSLCLLIIGGSSAQVATMPVVDLSIGPVAVNAQAVNIALALSVEFPTVGAAYRTANYDHSTTYVGYFDPKGCYAYEDQLFGTPLNSQYFYRTNTVDSDGYCNTGNPSGQEYGGNMLNYVATSSIDLLRYALTGGNRVADGAAQVSATPTGVKSTVDYTVLERAYLYNSWNLHDGYFPAKRIPIALQGKVTPNLGATGDFFGGGCKDKIWFGTSNANVACDTAGGTTSGNLNAKVPNTSGAVITRTVPEFTVVSTPTWVYSTTDYFLSNPYATTTVAPIVGPVVSNVVYSVVAGTNTTTPLPSNPSLVFYGTRQLDITASSGLTTTVPPVGAADSSVQAYTRSTADFYDTTNPGTGRGEVITAPAAGTNNTCKSTSPTRFRAPLDASGNPPTSVTSTTCSSLSPSASRTNLLSTDRTSNTFYRVWGTALYKSYQLQTIYKNYTSSTVYDVYTRQDQYLVYSTTIPGPMFARVRVCDATEAPLRTDLCKRYPNGNYKPVGEIQLKAEGARVSAFGYLMDNTTARYGGVLRAPMRFTGPTYRDTTGTLVTNPAPEWDLNSGVFTSDPLGESPTYSLSGVINYLNKFGTTGGTPGTYKSYDPVGELYYEALRYFQGLGPTADATTGITAAMRDGYPVYTSWTDPVQNSCQRKNFILTIGDVNTWYDRQIPGHGTGSSSALVNTTDIARSAENLLGTTTVAFNAVTWTSLLSGFESNVSKSYTDALGRSQNTLGNPNTRSGLTSMESTATGAGSSSAYYWAGAAYWANTQPIRFDLKNGKSMKDVRVKTFTIDVDEGGNGSIEDSNPRGIKPRSSAAYLAGKYGWFSDANLDGNPFKTSGGITNNKEWEDTDAPNTPDGYVIASQASKMIEGIRKFFNAATSEKGAVSVSSLSSQRFTTRSPNGDLFSPRFDTRDWSGTVQRSRLALNTTTQSIDTVAAVTWDAGQILTYASINTSASLTDTFVKPVDRKIFTYSRGATTASGQAFTTANRGNLDAAVTAALNTNPANGSTDSQIDARINYLRGDRSNEQTSTGGMFRRRNGILGDIINSGPIYKEDADSTVSGPGYAAFAASVSSRTSTIYVGSNDGMLHAFRANDGKELFAYIPRAVAPALNQLTNPAYVHRPYVDGVPLVREAQVGSSWKTVLVSGMGGGAQGVFALDVTSPESFGTSNVMFEFTDQDDADIGNILTQPKIVKLMIPPASAGAAPTYKWFIAVGSGYNNYKADGNASSSGQQALFLLSLDKSPSDAWTLNSNYYKILLPTPDINAANALGNPGFYEGLYGEVQYMYAGDLQGQLFRFDFSLGINATNVANSVQKSVGVAVPSFVAKDSSGVRQPITISPLVIPGPSNGYMVTFGTGKFVETSDAGTVTPQTMYGFFDPLTTTASHFNKDRNSLYQRTLAEGTASAVLSGSNSFTLGVNSGQYRGWYFDFTQTRERVAVEGAVGPGFVAINSTIPEGECSGDGSGRSYILNAYYGTSQSTISTVTDTGLLSRPNIIEVSFVTGSNVSTRSVTGRRSQTVSYRVLSTGTKVTDAGNVAVSGANSQSITLSTRNLGTVSKREIRNFND